MFAVQLLILVPLFFYVQNVFTYAVEKDTSLSAWKYLWLIPATFYILWFYHLYSNTQSSLEISLQPKRAAFLLCINMGAFLIYHMVTCLINEYDENAVLEQYEKWNILNMEMEAETIFTLASLNNVLSGSICAVHCNRITDQWLVDFEPAQKEMCRTALAAGEKLYKEYLHRK